MTQWTIADRMKDYFNRQIAWLEELVTGFDSLAEDLVADHLQRLIDRQAENAHRTRDLEQEFHALWKEWEASYQSVAEPEREEVKALAQRAEELSLALGQLSEAAVGKVEGELSRVRGAILAARRSRENLNRYSSGAGPGPGFMDRKA